MNVSRNAAIFVLAAFAGCSTASSDPSLVEAVRTAMNHVDAKRAAIVVADDTLNPLVRDAVGQYQRVVTSAEVPKSAAETLPAKWIRVQDAELRENEKAFVRLVVGPVPAAAPEGTILLDCGTIYGLNMKRDAAGAWIIDYVSVAMC